MRVTGDIENRGRNMIRILEEPKSLRRRSRSRSRDRDNEVDILRSGKIRRMTGKRHQGIHREDFLSYQQRHLEDFEGETDFEVDQEDYSREKNQWSEMTMAEHMRSNNTGKETDGSDAED